MAGAVPVDRPQVRVGPVGHDVEARAGVDDGAAVGRDLRIGRVLELEDVARAEGRGVAVGEKRRCGGAQNEGGERKQRPKKRAGFSRHSSSPLAGLPALQSSLGRGDGSRSEQPLEVGQRSALLRVWFSAAADFSSSTSSRTRSSGVLRRCSRSRVRSMSCLWRSMMSSSDERYRASGTASFRSWAGQSSLAPSFGATLGTESACGWAPCGGATAQRLPADGRAAEET